DDHQRAIVPDEGALPIQGEERAGCPRPGPLGRPVTARQEAGPDRQPHGHGRAGRAQGDVRAVGLDPEDRDRRATATSPASKVYEEPKELERLLVHPLNAAPRRKGPEFLRAVGPRPCPHACPLIKPLIPLTTPLCPSLYLTGCFRFSISITHL